MIIRRQELNIFRFVAELLPCNARAFLIGRKPCHRFCSSSVPVVKRKAKILSGIQFSSEIRSHLAKEISHLQQCNANFIPGLAIIQVGDLEESNIYIRQKMRAAGQIGVTTRHIKLLRSITSDELFQEIDKLNADSQVHGIIVQLPLDMEKSPETCLVTNRIAPAKDVDGLHEINVGYLASGNLNEGIIPCTPLGCLELIKRTGIQIKGSTAVVLGRSRIVGAPMANLLQWYSATVTIGHSKTRNIPELVSSADILVVAIRQPQMIKGSWVKPGAVVIDCGINTIADASKRSGYRLVGDVDFKEVQQVSSFITPVPGGVGPMTVAMLIQNTVEAAKKTFSMS